MRQQEMVKENVCVGIGGVRIDGVQLRRKAAKAKVVGFVRSEARAENWRGVLERRWGRRGCD